MDKKQKALIKRNFAKWLEQQDKVPPRRYKILISTDKVVFYNCFLCVGINGNISIPPGIGIAFDSTIYSEEKEGEMMKIIQKIKKWIKDNALDQTTFSTICSDDGIIMFKKTDIKALGDWSQEQWDEIISEFEEKYIDYKEFYTFLDKLEKEDIKKVR